jgi:Flp pilus assembly protein TadD
VHVRNADGESALHVAARGGHATIIDLIAAQGGDLQGRNREDKTPLQVADDAGHHAVAEVIRRLLGSKPPIPPVEVVPGVASVSTAKLGGEPRTIELPHAWEHAQDEVNAGHLEAALPLLDKASEQRAGDAAVWMLKGQVLARLNRFQEALRSFDKAVALEADNVAALKDKGLCLMQLGQAAAALVFFERAQARAEKDPVVWLCKAEAHEELEDYDNAVRSYDKVLELEPDHPTALEQKAACLVDAGRNEEAVVLSKRSVERHPQDGAAWYLRAILLDGMGSTEGSSHALEEAQKLGMTGDVNLLDLRRRWTDPLPRL